MSSLKRPLDDTLTTANVPPAKLCHIMHTIVPETGNTSNSEVNIASKDYSSLDSSNGQSNFKVEVECALSSQTIEQPIAFENHVHIPNFGTLTQEEKRKIKMELMYKRKDLEAAKCHESLRNLATLMDAESDECKIKLASAPACAGPALVTHAGQPALEIDPQPLSEEEEMDRNDGLLVEKRKKRMFAVLLSYSGKGYHGLQK